ncbi:MAG TPA: SDR family oxidoreductase [Devosia sp.]|nr:SDR family oxidoreductase [Devosia sp.]
MFINRTITIPPAVVFSVRLFALHSPQSSFRTYKNPANPLFVVIEVKMESAKCAIITGAGSGIGKAVALGMAAAGYHLVICGRRTGPLQEVAALCKGAGGNALAVKCDVTAEADVVAMFKKARNHLGHLDVVFNNAGVFMPAARIDKTSLADFQAGIDVNLTGAFLVAREAFIIMRDQKPRGGRIINNGSIAAHVPRPNSVSYSTSKHGIAGLSKSIALEGRG